MYVRYFGRAADAQTIASYAEHKKTSVILKNIIADADAEKDLDTTEFVNNAFQNLFGRKANTKEMNKYSKVIEKGKNLPINSIVKSAAKADKAVYNNKKAVALKYAELGGTKELDLSKISKGNLVDLNKVFTLTDLTNAIENLADNSGIPSAFDGKAFILTTGADPITGTAKNDIFVATEATLTSNDKLNGGQGQDTLDIVDRGGSTFNGFEANGIETIKVTADSAAATIKDTNVDLTYATDVTKLVNANSSQNLTFHAIDTVPVKGLELTKVTGGNTTLNFEATAVVGTADVLNVKLDNVKSTANTAVSSIVSNGIETVNVTTTGTESKLVDIGAGQTKVVIAGDKNLTIDNGATILTATTTIDASAFKGNLTLGTVDSATINNDVEVIGGSGNDKVSFNNGFEIGDKFDGGTGTDTIIMTDSAASLAAGATLANVEELEISDNGQRTIDMDNFASVSKVIYQAGISAASTATVKDAVSGLTVNVDSVVANGTLNVALKADASSDVVNVEIDEVTAANTIVALNANEAETLNLTVNDNAAVVGKGALTVTNLSATDATKLNIKSDADLTIANVVNPATAILATIDANTSTGNLTISNVNTVATGATIILGAGNDVYTVATSNGADTITLGAGADKIVYNAVAQSDTDMDTITDFKQGQDTLDLTAAALGVTDSSKFVGNKATFAQAQGALKGATNVSAVFQQDEKILWVDIDGNGTLDNRDFRIKLDGITDLTTIDLGFGAGVSFTAKKVAFDTTKATDSDEGTVTGIKDDTINATVAQLVGSAVDGLVGSDVLNISATAAAGEIADLTGSFTNVETVNIDATVEGLRMDFADLAANQTTAINGVSGKVQTLTVNGGTSLTNTTISNIENLDMSGTVSMTAAQHNAFASIVGSTGADIATLTTAGTIAANSTVETYSIVEGSTITVGALAQNVTETGAAGTVSTIILGNGVYTGTYTAIDTTDIVKVGTTTNVSAIAGLNTGAVISFQNTATAGAGLTLSNAQNGVVTFADTTNAQTITVNGAADTFVVADGIESYIVIGGSAVTVSATNTAVNITGSAVAAASTVVVGGNTVTGTYSLNDTGNADSITATNGADITGVNNGAATTAEALNVTGTITMTAAQLAGFTTQDAVGTSDVVIVTTSAAHGTIDADYEGITFNGAGVDTANFGLADAADGTTSGQASVAVSLAGGGADVITIRNTSVDTGAKVINITGFGADDKISSVETAQTATSTGIFTNDYAGGALVLADSGVVEIDATAYQAGTLTNSAAVLAWLTAAGVKSTGANDVVTVVAYNGAGTAGIYQMYDAAGNSAFDTIELIGTVNMADNGFVGANFA